MKPYLKWIENEFVIKTDPGDLTTEDITACWEALKNCLLWIHLKTKTGYSTGDVLSAWPCCLIVKKILDYADCQD